MNEPHLVLALVGLGLIAIAVPMLLRRVPPNPLYGLRVPATYQDEQVWYDANAASARDLIALGVVQVLLALVPPALGWSGESHMMMWGFVLTLGAVMVAVIGWRRADRMLKQKRVGASPPG